MLRTAYRVLAGGQGRPGLARKKCSGPQRALMTLYVQRLQPDTAGSGGGSDGAVVASAPCDHALPPTTMLAPPALPCSHLLESPWPLSHQMMERRMAVINLAANIDVRLRKLYEVRCCTSPRPDGLCLFAAGVAGVSRGSCLHCLSTTCTIRSLLHDLVFWPVFQFCMHTLCILCRSSSVT